MVRGTNWEIFEGLMASSCNEVGPEVFRQTHLRLCFHAVCQGWKEGAGPTGLWTWLRVFMFPMLFEKGKPAQYELCRILR